ncbi:hypothetical protein [Nannocystis sp. SCPEA4]|uniref:hypothetical protein n=1 Tax=Nannocystis sp. SCPEA4 TaxID=2996787 RepID=UPI0022717F59|nr:hypothetical protein [Nannocystis sp. SCPEA4]MCY1057499.1 hypothetical protein [Nannocystis sp. SCPEA4]
MKTSMRTLPAAALALCTLAACPAEEATTDSPDTDPSTTDPGSTTAEQPTTGGDACPAPAGPTMHDGELGMNEVWTAEGSPHIVTRFVSVPIGATLTIEPCAEVRMQADASLVFGNTATTEVTTLKAEGEPERPIRFVRDGDEPWGAIVAYAPAQLFLAHTTLTGGGSDEFLLGASLMLRGDSETPTKKLALVDHVTIEDSVGSGAVAQWTSGFMPGSTQLKVTGSGNEAYPYPLWVGEHALDTLPDGDYTGNLVDEIHISDEGANSSSGLQEDGAMRDLGVPYHFGEFEGSRFNIGGPAQALTTLTIEPGVTIKFLPGTALQIEHWTSDVNPASGALVAVGTPEKPITFTSAAPNPAPGDWIGLWYGSVPAANNRLEHARVEYAGGECSCVGFTCADSDEASILFIEGLPAGAFIQNTTISHSAGHGIARGWQGGGPDFSASNTFEDIAGCNQTIPRDKNNYCPDGDGCG